jgi:hypothetical protein
MASPAVWPLNRGLSQHRVTHVEYRVTRKVTFAASGFQRIPADVCRKQNRLILYPSSVTHQFAESIADIRPVPIRGVGTPSLTDRAQRSRFRERRPPAPSRALPKDHVRRCTA